MKLRAILADEEDHKRVIALATAAAVGANSGRRRPEIISHPPQKRATLIRMRWPRAIAVRVRIAENRAPLIADRTDRSPFCQFCRFLGEGYFREQGLEPFQIAAHRNDLGLTI